MQWRVCELNDSNIDDDAALHHVITPFGGVEAYFDAGGVGVRLKGARHGVAHIKDIMSQVTGEHGRTISVRSCEPMDFVRYCQPEWSGIKIMPPFHIALELHKEEMAATQSTEPPTD